MLVSQSSQKLDMDGNKRTVPVNACPSQPRTLPVRFRQENSNEENDGAICIICKRNEPEEVTGRFVLGLIAMFMVIGLITTVLLEPTKHTSNIIVPSVLLTDNFCIFL